MAKRTVIIKGGGWKDTDVWLDVLDVPADINLNVERDAYKEWYTKEYLPPMTKFGKDSPVLFMTFIEWLNTKGATCNSTVEVFEDE